MIQEWVRVPVGRDAAAWRTVATERTVLAVVHTVACATHIVDAVQLLEPDRRVQVVFTQAPDLFGNGVQEYLRTAGAVTIGWHQATQTDFDLVVAADCAGVHELRGPLVAIGHGVPNNKLTPPPLGGPDSRLVVGLSAPWLTWYGRLLPAMVAVSHRDVLPVLARECPAAVPVARVTGDLCQDRLAVSRRAPSAYRHALGVAAGRTVVAVCSTWGPASVLGRSWGELSDLLSRLPRDEFEVYVAVHPGAWYTHGPRQMLGWLPGLRVVDPTSWRGLVAASDVLIGDHGSATLYAAAAGVPVLRAGAAEPGTAPGSPAEVLASVSPPFEPHRSLAAQLRAAVEAGRREPYARVAAALTSEPGRAAGLLRAEMYRLLALPEPGYGCAPAPVGPPQLVDR